MPSKFKFSNTHKVIVFSLFLILLALSLMVYKIVYLGFPLFQDETDNIWNIEAKITFDSKIEDNSGIVSLTIPSKQNGFFDN